MAHVEPTEEQLDQAWRLVRKSDWPGTRAAVMDHPIRGRLVRLYAAGIALGSVIGSRHVTRPEVVRPEPHVQRTHQPAPARPVPTPTQEPLFNDRKRAAAGDRDDD